jgi:hypothetical protein
VLTVMPVSSSFPRKRESIRLTVNPNFPDGFLLAQE